MFKLHASSIYHYQLFKVCVVVMQSGTMLANDTDNPGISITQILAIL